MKWTRFAAIAAVLFPALAQAQLYTLSKEELTELTKQSPFDRFPDGRPKIPDSLLERARGMSAEEAWAVFNTPAGRTYRTQYEDGFQVLHPKLKLAGRAFTVQFMPIRPDLDTYILGKAQARGITRWHNQTAIDMLQPGDVLVVDLMGKVDGGTIVGDNLFYYVMKTTKNGGIVCDGAIRDLEGISEMEMPAYFRRTHPSAIANVSMTGINVPVRIGGATVLPGDLVLGDPEGVYFVPPHLVKAAVDNADVIHIHDEWSRKKFDEGKYKSSDIYSTPRDPALKKEYDEYLNKRLAEIRKNQ